jgi:hypothetical protein
MPETEIIDIINELFQERGPQHGITESSYDGDNDSASVAFNYKGDTFLISSEDIDNIDVGEE